MKRRDFIIAGSGLAAAGITGCGFHNNKTITVKKDTLNQSILKRIVNNAVSKKYIYGAVFYVSTDDNSIDLISSSAISITTVNIILQASINFSFLHSF